VRIEEFSIRRYGPLCDTGVMRPGGFTLFFARNEEGKTLTIEALVRMSLGGGAKSLQNINRVDETPDGYVIVDGRKLPEAGSLDECSEIGPDYWRNIFIIRNSDLEIATAPAIYSGVTNHLTGLRTRDIEAVKAALRGIGKLTEKDLRISNAEPDGKLKARIESAGQLTADVEELRERVQAAGFDESERRLAETAEELARVERDLREQEDARKRDTYHTCREALGRVEKSLGRLEALLQFSEEAEQTWRDNEGAIQRTRDRVKELKAKAAETRTRIEGLQAELRETEQTLAELSRQSEAIEDLRYVLREHDSAEERTARGEAWTGALKWGFGVLAGLSALALGAGLLRGGTWAFALAALFGLPGLACLGLLLRQARRRGKAAAVLARARQEAARVALLGETSGQIRSAITELESRRIRADGTASRLRAELVQAGKEFEKITEGEVPKAEKGITDAVGAIEEIRGTSGAQTREEYRGQLEEQRGLRERLHAGAAVLADRLGGDAQQPAESLAFWAESLAPYAEFADAAQGVVHSEQTVSALVADRDRLTRERRELQQSATRFRSELDDVARRANDVLRPEDDRVLCETTGELERIHARLEAFVREHEDRAELARQAIAVFEEIGRDEEEKVAELFGPDSAVSRRFAEITGGLYEAVLYEYEDDERKVHVRTAGGETLDAEWLSGGAYDQLYLSVRLALGEALLGGQAGFFIMDDPFVKADAVRLERQLEVLRRIVKAGWQVLYFTAKAEVRDALAGDIDTGLVQELALPGLRRGS